MEKIILTTKDELENLIHDTVKKALSDQALSKDNSATEYITLEEASAFLNLASQTIYGLTSKREIPFFKKGKKLYFSKKDLESWLLSGRKTSKSEMYSAIKGGKQ